MRRFIRALAIAALATLAPAWASADDQPTDQQNAQQIAGALRSSGQLIDYSIGVKYENGTAWLLGRVANEEQRDRAVAMARKMPAVTDVVSKLEIKSSRTTAGTNPAAQSGLKFAGDNSAAHHIPRASGKVVFPENTTRARRSQQGEINQTAGEESPQLGNPNAAVAPSMNRAGMPMPSMPAAAASQAANYDPGDPLAQTGPSRLSAAASRLFATEPMNAPAQPKRPTQPNVGTRQVGFTADSRTPAVRGKAPVAQVQAMQAIDGGGAPMQGAPMQGMPMQGMPMQGMPANCGPQYQMASRGGAFQGQPIQAPAGVSPVGYHYPRGVPTGYGPAMGGCAGGACNGPAMEQPNMPGYAWPSYAAYPNYGAVTYPRQYSPTAWPYIGPFYPYPQVPLGWRKVALEWDDGWWWLDFYDTHHHH